jgi:hypothetical protein
MHISGITLIEHSTHLHMIEGFNSAAAMRRECEKVTLKSYKTLKN